MLKSSTTTLRISKTIVQSHIWTSRSTTKKGSRIIQWLSIQCSTSQMGEWRNDDTWRTPGVFGKEEPAILCATPTKTHGLLNSTPGWKFHRKALLETKESIERTVMTTSRPLKPFLQHSQYTGLELFEHYATRRKLCHLTLRIKMNSGLKLRGTQNWPASLNTTGLKREDTTTPRHLYIQDTRRSPFILSRQWNMMTEVKGQIGCRWGPSHRYPNWQCLLNGSITQRGAVCDICGRTQPLTCMCGQQT